MQDGERNVPLHFEVRGSKLKVTLVITKKVTVIVTDPWRGPFRLCQFSSNFEKDTRSNIQFNRSCIFIRVSKSTPRNDVAEQPHS